MNILPLSVTAEIFGFMVTCWARISHEGPLLVKSLLHLHPLYPTPQIKLRSNTTRQTYLVLPLITNDLRRSIEDILIFLLIYQKKNVEGMGIVWSFSGLKKGEGNKYEIIHFAFSATVLKMYKMKPQIRKSLKKRN